MSGRPWLPWEVEFLRKHYPDHYTEAIARALGFTVDRVLTKANKLGLRKERDFVAHVARLRSAEPDHGGRRHWFQKGLVPWNKGKPFAPGGEASKHRFKPGNRPHTWVPVGTFRVGSSGVLQLKFSDEPGHHWKRWKSYAQIVWESEHGPMPKGHIVVFKSAAQRTTDPDLITLDKLECITRRENLRRNSVHARYPKEVARLVQLRGAITRQINRRAKEGKA